jgi:hypothetical protein
LAFLVILLILVYFSGLIYVKYLIILVYIRGVVVFILYISCICWYITEGFSWWLLLLGLFCIYIFDYGLFVKFSDVGEFIWIYLFFRFFFNRLVIGYSSNLFKVSGSLRF